MDFTALAQQCAPTVHPETMAAIVRVESGFNPYAIGIVGGRLARQPRDKAEAIATARALRAAGYNFSVGVGQINRYNLPRYGLDDDKAFDPCESLRAGAAILTECFERARRRIGDRQQALQAAFSCYYSGNFRTGFIQDIPGQPSYVQKVLDSAVLGKGQVKATSMPVVAHETQRRAVHAHLPRIPAPAERRGPGSTGEAVSVYAKPPSDIMAYR